MSDAKPETTKKSPYPDAYKDAKKLYRKLMGLTRVSANHDYRVREIQLALMSAFWKGKYS